MAPLPVIPNVFRVAVNWFEESTNQIGINVMHFRAPTMSSAELGETLKPLWTLAMFHPMVSDATCDQLTITALDGSTASIPSDQSGSDLQGGTAGDFSPASSVCVSFYSVERGRSKRGRVFLPFTAEGAMSDGAIDPSSAVNVAEAWAAWSETVNAAGATHVIASYKLGSVVDVNQYVVKAQLATQRKRQTRVRYP